MKLNLIGAFVVLLSATVAFAQNESASVYIPAVEDEPAVATPYETGEVAAPCEPVQTVAPCAPVRVEPCAPAVAVEPCAPAAKIADCDCGCGTVDCDCNFVSVGIGQRGCCLRNFLASVQANFQARTAAFRTARQTRYATRTITKTRVVKTVAAPAPCAPAAKVVDCGCGN